MTTVVVYVFSDIDWFQQSDRMGSVLKKDDLLWQNNAHEL